ncbi:MAG TPA: TetR/AcrR family transcriptional regulator [Microvirga sp.]|jgi:AcrR family transcriptional regulator|nr:TetR/AcrR family transcriptional regulator [Microvirga sp.]
MRTTERREQLRDRLVEAAERTVASQGLAAVRARDLAQEVGCALGSIYTVFPDLDALVLAVNARTLARLDAALAPRPAAAPSPRGDALEDAIDDLVGLALRYLDFAAANPLPWRALFEHRMPEGQPVPEAHLAAQMRLFAYVEEPLRALLPGLKGRERALVARSLFSAVHGVVGLGLEEKLVPMPMATLRRQLALLVRATARGLPPEQDAAD